MSVRVAAAALLIALAVPRLGAQAPRKIDTSLKAVVAAATAYVSAYQKDLAFVLADELATQKVLTPSGTGMDSRRTRAEFFLTYLPNESAWISVRDVREVDGVAVSDPDDVLSLIQRTPLWRLANLIAQKNSRFNIGNVRRTFNEPTIALLVVNPRHQGRFKFERAAVSTSASPVVTVKFRERDRPTLITSVHGEPAFTQGELDIDAATGRVERTRIQLSVASVRAALTTTYALDGRLNLWVPAGMSERYENTDDTFGQTVTVDTTYTNYRRFDTAVIIK